MATVFPAKGYVDDLESLNLEAANQDTDFTLRSRGRKRNKSGPQHMTTWLLISGPEGSVLGFYLRLRQMVSQCLGTARGLPPWYRVRLQSITQGQVQAAQIDTTATTSHAYLPADTGEGVRVGADAVIASEASGEDPSLDQSSAVRLSSRAQAGQQAPTADTHQAEAGVIFSKKDSGARTLTRELDTNWFSAQRKHCRSSFWNKANCECTVYSNEGHCSGSQVHGWFLPDFF
jgi:hypothetical protein